MKNPTSQPQTHPQNHQPDAETLRFVRTCTDPTRALAQLRHAEYTLSRREHWARHGDPRAASQLEGSRSTAAAWMIRVQELGCAMAPTEAEAEPQPEATPQPATRTPRSTPKPAASAKPRCQHRAQIYGFRRAAIEKGLDMEAKDRRRAAVGMFLGRRLESCSELNGPEWEACAHAIRVGRLFW